MTITRGMFERYGRPEIVPSGCKEWRGKRQSKSYGYMRKQLAHRIAWQLQNGDIPDGLCVLHRCDNPLCVNVDHLFLGTHIDNMRDKVSKGRCNPKPWTMSDDKRAELRLEIATGERRWGWKTKLAREYGVTKQYVSQLAKKIGEPLTPIQI